LHQEGLGRGKIDEGDMIALLLSLLLTTSTAISGLAENSIDPALTLECKDDCLTIQVIDYPVWVYEPKPDITVLELSKIMELMFRINQAPYRDYDYGALINDYGVERHFRKEK
jgi:hypothetical protein